MYADGSKIVLMLQAAELRSVFDPVCFVLLYVDHKNAVTRLTFSITGIRHMTIKILLDRKIVLQVIGYAVCCVLTGRSVRCDH